MILAFFNFGHKSCVRFVDPLTRYLKKLTETITPLPLQDRIKGTWDVQRRKTKSEKGIGE